MEKQFVKEVLTRIVDIDAKAEACSAAVADYKDDVERDIKREARQMELTIMKGVRAKVKDNFHAAIAEAEAEEKRILSTSQSHTERVSDYFHANQDAVVDALFAAIFGEHDG